MFLLYNVLLTLLAPIWAPWMWWRTRARRESPNWQERFGNFSLQPTKDRRRIWVHAVSVGEVIAVMPILQSLRGKLPDDEIILSVTTSSGHQTAREKAAGLYDHLVYLPIDTARFQLAAMQRVQPAVVAIMETELWLNFLWAAKVFDARTLLINGRISDRSFPRARKVRFFYRALLAKMDRCLMQTKKDAERISALGAMSVEAFGNCKFDQALAGVDSDRDFWRGELGLDPERPVVVVGSIRAEEFGFLAEAIRPDIQWVIAPRHVERAAEIELPGQVAFRSRGEKMADFLILDTYGELDRVYAVADIVVVGGGFANLGGQNIIQPLAHGKPVLHGPHMQNFGDVASMAVDAGASLVCSTPDELRAEIGDLIGDPDKRRRMGDAARALVQANVGAGERYAGAIAEEAQRVRSQGP